MGIFAFPGTRFLRTLCILGFSLYLLPGSAGAEKLPQSSPANTISAASLAAPPKARAHLDRARRALAKGHEDEYQRELSFTLDLDPQFADAYLLRASHELLRDRYTMAIDDVLTAQRLEPSIPRATILHAIACNQLKLFDQAFLLLDHLSPSESDTWQAIYERTRAAVGLEDVDAALRWSERALTAVPASRIDDTVLLRADALLMAHRWAETVTQLERYLKSPRPQPKRAEVLALLERIPELARRDAVSLIAANPQ